MLSLKVSTIGMPSPRKRGEGLRIGTVRFLPRGVPKKDYARLGYFDVWLPNLAPSPELLKRLKHGGLSIPAFFRAYRKEMAHPEARHLIDLLAAVARQTPIALGCYCEDETHCHRSVLVELVRSTG